ncbi:MAG: DNA polymerase III subunit [Elusimicrobiales bacterium]|jgi:DNA polymerase-3 subunit delta'
MSFNDILGHEGTIKKLKALIAGGRVPPALLFCGVEGAGKFLAAKEFAKALNCTHTPPENPRSESDLFGTLPGAPLQPSALSLQPVDDSCGLCVSCSQIGKGVHPDVRVIDSEFQGLLLDEDAQKQKTLRIDTVREFMPYVYRKAALSPWKIFIINDAHTLNINAQNAMLKILEEPPAGTIFILVAAKKNLLLQTIISRSYAVEFRRLSPAAVKELLERSGIAPDEASALGELSGGSVKRSRDIKKVRDRMAAITAAGPQKIFKLVSSLPREPYLAREEAKLMLDMLLVSARKAWLAVPSGGQARAHAALVRKLLEYRRFLNQNVSHGLVLEAALLESDKLSVSLRY